MTTRTPEQEKALAEKIKESLVIQEEMLAERERKRLEETTVSKDEEEEKQTMPL